MGIRNYSSDFVRGGTICLTKAGLAFGSGDASALDLAAPNGAGIDFAINGYMYHLLDAADHAVTAAASQADVTACLYLVTLTTGGVLATVKGVEVLTADLESGFEVLTWPTPAENTCPIGAVHIETDGTTFVAGTDDWNQSNQDDTYYDIALGIPEIPLTT